LADADSVLHEANQLRARRWPRSMLCTSTHDTKRSADVRARLDVLCEVAGEWRDRVRRWHRWNRRHRTRIRWRYAPDRNSEYLLYQTLIGIWPLANPSAQTGEQAPSRLAVTESFRERVEAYMEKAAREAKQHTSWIDPNPAFEAALRDFVRALLSSEKSPRFLADLDRFVQRIARPGLWNALARTLVHLTAPGTPDIYQGDELWNFSLVDPDNRRPVDFESRRQLLPDLSEVWERSREEERHLFLRQLVEGPEDGRIKLHVISQALRVRRANPELFLQGHYEPLATNGPAAAHVFAFARRRGPQVALTLVSRRTASLCRDPSMPPVGRQLWSGTTLSLPEDLATGPWTNALTGETLETPDRPGWVQLAVGDALESFPVALLLHPC
ncbi:MAG: malto-oligosyltrehalose synthase, partial [Gemmatimonadota bacterium]